MSPARVEIVILHLAVNLVKVPVIKVEAIDRAYNARAVTPARAVHVEFTSCRVGCKFQKLINLLGLRVLRIAHRNIEVTNSAGLKVVPLIRRGVVAQVNHGLDAERLKV